MRFDIEPHKGIGPVKLGMLHEEVIALMTQIGGRAPVPRFKLTDCFFRNSFQVSYNDHGCVEFIEAANEPELEFMFKGKDVFDMPAGELLAHIGQFDSFAPELSKEGYEYLFPSLILVLWDIDPQYDHRGGWVRPMFGAVGIGDPHYLAAVRAIKLDMR